MAVRDRINLIKQEVKDFIENFDPKDYYPEDFMEDEYS